jgi:hypothetical protein
MTFLKRSTPPRKLSPRTEAKRKAAGEKFIRSTIPKQSAKAADRKRRKSDSYRKKLAAYKRSETYRLVEGRAANRCEATGPAWGFGTTYTERCGVLRGGVHEGKLHHHHLTYARFGGKERPEDVQVLCTYHHEKAEAKARPWNRARFSKKSSKVVAQGEA